MRSPLRDDLLLENVGLVERHEDLGDVRFDELRVRLSDETFDTTEERLLMLLRRRELHSHRESKSVGAVERGKVEDLPSLGVRREP